MAVVRDPAFWKRFSTAVHLDEEFTGTRPTTPATTSTRPPLKHACVVTLLPPLPSLPSPLCPPSAQFSTQLTHPNGDSWLERQQQKKRKNRWTLCLSILGFIIIVTIVILLLFWMSQHGWFAHGEKVSFP